MYVYIYIYIYIYININKNPSHNCSFHNSLCAHLCGVS